MKKLLSVFAFISLSMSATHCFASLADCKGLYVGQMQSVKGAGFHSFTLLVNPTDVYGGYWINLNGWEKEDRNAVMSTLLSAKLAGKKVAVDVSKSGETVSDCAIATTPTTLNYIILESGQ